MMNKVMMVFLFAQMNVATLAVAADFSSQVNGEVASQSFGIRSSVVSHARFQKGEVNNTLDRDNKSEMGEQLIGLIGDKVSGNGSISIRQPKFKKKAIKSIASEKSEAPQLMGVVR